MKKIKFRTVIFVSLFLASCSALFSFSAPKGGGDSFMIYLNDKLIVKQYLHDVKNVPEVQLQQLSADDKVRVFYSHCGQPGKNRYLTIRNAKSEPLKVFKFPEASGDQLAMSFKLEDMAAIQKENKTPRLQVLYTSKELPAGRVLATVRIDGDMAKK